jgi:predicted dinucleotide-binding enzyme
MDIAVLGAGPVGRAIGGRWLRAGHRVRFGARHPETHRAAIDALGSGAHVMPVEEALAGADVVLLAVPADAVEDLLAAHATALDGRLILDATNRLGAGPMHALAAGQRHGRRLAFRTLGL